MTMSDDSGAVPLVIAGAGAAGMMAALYAAHLGVESVLLEKSILKGTNAELSGGLLQAAGTRFQREQGIDDGPEIMAADILAKSKASGDEELVYAICRHSKDFIHFIDEYVTPLHLDTGVKWVGHSNPRMHSCAQESGHGLVMAMRRAVRKSDKITFMDRAPIREVIVREGAVVSVVADTGAGAESIPARNVLLATAGFGNNREMLAEYCPDALPAVFIGSENSTGDGIRLGREVGADVARMSSWQGHPHVNPKHGTHLSAAIPYAGGIVVNQLGRRFAREDIGYSEFTLDVLAQPGHTGVEIFDRRVADALAANHTMREAMSAGAARMFESLGSLAEANGLPYDQLRYEIETFNAAARGERDDPFGRTIFGRPLGAPFYASVITGGLAHTQGGLVINPQCRVLRPDRSQIAGLYAAGGTAVGISGDGAVGYTSGNGLAHALSTALIAAEDVVRTLAYRRT